MSLNVVILQKLKLESCFSTDDAYIFSGSEDGLICVWDLVDTKIVHRAKGHAGPVTGLSYHPKEEILLSCGIDGTVRMWK